MADSEKFVFFYASDSPFSQWHRTDFQVNGRHYCCAEQYMMQQKAILFKDYAMARKIMGVNSPRKQKAFGRKVANFDEKTWNEKCYDIVKKGNVHKFRQNETIQQALFDTIGTTLVEASPTDTIWGIGLSAEDPDALNRSTWRGKNLLGQALTEVREQLMSETEQGQGHSFQSDAAADDGGVDHTQSNEADQTANKQSATNKSTVKTAYKENEQKYRVEIAEGSDSITATVKADSEKFTFFYSNNHPFSQWHKVNFHVDGQHYCCAEQYMMYQKAVLFKDDEMARKIMGDNNPRKQKAFGRRIENFDEKVWKEKCYDIVKKGNLHKFRQNETIQQALFDTIGTTLVEASPTDTIWGIGLSAENPDALNRSTWRGKNLLGQALTEVREQLMSKTEQGQGHSFQSDAAADDGGVDHTQSNEADQTSDNQSATNKSTVKTAYKKNKQRRRVQIAGGSGST